MGVFKNIERGVVSTSFNKKELKKFDMVSESAISNQALRRIADKEKYEKLESNIFAKEKEDNINARLESLSKHSILESQIDNRIYNIGNDYKLSIFKDIVYEVFSNALVLDDDFVYEHYDVLKKVTDEFIDENGGYNLLESAINETDSGFLKKLKSVCESLSNDIVKRVILESKTCKKCDDEDLFNMNMTSDEEEKLDYSKNNLDVEKISELVKDKVLTVVRDEKENQAKHEELVSNIEEELSEDEEVKDNESIDEAMSRIVMNNNILNESTLFSALLQDSYETILAENMAITSTTINNSEKDDEFSDSYDVNADSTKYEDVSDNDDETSIEELDGIDNDLVLEKKTPTVNLDMVMAEALVKYTLMETMYTLKLKNYTYDDIKKMTDEVSNRHITKTGPLTEALTTKVEDPDEKVREAFFKNLRNLKNMRSVDIAKKDITKILQESSDALKENLVKVGINQLEEEKERNFQFTETYNGYIEFLNKFSK